MIYTVKRVVKYYFNKYTVDGFMTLKRATFLCISLQMLKVFILININGEMWFSKL